MLLENKVAVVYGGSGAIGASIARSFATEGAQASSSDGDTTPWPMSLSGSGPQVVPRRPDFRWHRIASWHHRNRDERRTRTNRHLAGPISDAHRSGRVRRIRRLRPCEPHDRTNRNSQLRIRGRSSMTTHPTAHQERGPTVDEFLDDLDHPRVDDVRRLRATLLADDDELGERISGTHPASAMTATTGSRSAFNRATDSMSSCTVECARATIRSRSTTLTT